MTKNNKHLKELLGEEYEEFIVFRDSEWVGIAWERTQTSPRNDKKH